MDHSPNLANYRASHIMNSLEFPDGFSHASSKDLIEENDISYNK